LTGAATSLKLHKQLGKRGNASCCVGAVEGFGGILKLTRGSGRGFMQSVVLFP